MPRSYSLLTVERYVFLQPQKFWWVDSTLMFRKRCDDQYNTLKGYPHIYKFSNIHPGQIGTIFKSIGCFCKLLKAVKGIRSPNPDFPNSGISDFS